MSKKKYWFKRKRYGWGWMPVTIQGWALILVHVSFMIGLWFLLFDGVEKGEEEIGLVMLYLGIVTLATANMILITKAKSPPGKWRWGKEESDNPDEDF